MAGKKTVKDILKLLSAQVASNELSTVVAASSLDEVELTDEGYEEIKDGIGGLYSIEAAVNNPDISKKILDAAKPEIQNQTLYSIEKRLKEIFAPAGFDLGDNTKAHDILNAIEAQKDKLTGGDVDEATQSLIKSLENDKAQFAADLKAIKEQKEQEIESLKNDFEQQQLKHAFKEFATKKQWAEAYKDDDVQSALLDRKWEKITAKATLKLQDGVIVAYNKDHPDKEYYEGPKKLTFPDLVEPEIEPYLKKSDPAPTAPSQGSSNNGQKGDLTPAQKYAQDMELVHGKKASG